MLRIENISSEHDQRHVVLSGDLEIVLRLRFMSSVESWFFSVEYDGRTVNNIRLAAGVLHIRSVNLPFDFFVSVMDTTGLDPFREQDFSEGRCILSLVTPDEMEAIRGQAVQ